MYGCDLLFDATTAAKVRDEIKEKTGGPCPCEVGNRCPLLPADLAPLLLQVTIPVRQSA